MPDPTSFDSDSMLAFMTELKKSFSELRKEMGLFQDSAGSGIHKTTEETERFGKTVERHSHNVENMGSLFGNLGKLTSGFGVAATVAFTAVKAISSEIGSQLDLRNFAKDVGLSTDAVARLRVQLSASGIDANTANQQIGSLMGKLDDIKMLGKGSATYRDLAANDQRTADLLAESEKRGDRQGSIDIVRDKFAQTKREDVKLWWQQKLGLNPSTVDALNRNMTGLVAPVVPTPEQQKNLDAAKAAEVNAQTRLSNIWSSIVQSHADQFNVWTDYFAKGEVAKPGDKPATFNERFGDWKKKDSDEGDGGDLPKNARPMEFQRSELDIQKDSNKTLQDIRNIITDQKGGPGGGGTSTDFSSVNRGGSRGSGSGSGSAMPGSFKTAALTTGDYSGTDGGAGVASRTGGPIPAGGGDVDAAIRATAAKAGMDEAHWKAIASIESALQPGSNANKRTQYKGLFQIGARGANSEWARKGRGNLYNAQDNAEAAAALAAENAAGFRRKFKRDPTPAEIYMMHQQGLGFYTKGAMSNIRGNPYPGMRGPQTHESFERGWTEELERRAKRYAARNQIDKSVADSRDLGGAKIKVDFSNYSTISGATQIEEVGVFKKLNISRSPQAPVTGGGVDDFNRFAFE